MPKLGQPKTVQARILKYKAQEGIFLDIGQK